MLLDTQRVEFGPKLAKIALNICKLHVKYVKECEGVYASVGKYHHRISQLEYILLDTQHV